MNLKVKLTAGWVAAGLVKENPLTCWVMLFNGHIIKRKYNQVRIKEPKVAAKILPRVSFWQKLLQMIKRWLRLR